MGRRKTFVLTLKYMDEHNEFKVKNYQIRRDDNTKGRNKYVTNSDFQEVRIHF